MAPARRMTRSNREVYPIMFLPIPITQRPNCMKLSLLLKVRKERVVHCVSCTYAALWQVLQHLEQQVLEVLVVLDHGKLFSQVASRVVAELLEQLRLERYSLRVFGSLVRSEASHDLEDSEQLVAFGFAFEDGLQREQFGQDASCSPDVNGSGVVSDAQDEFRSSIVARDDIGGVSALGIDALAAAEVADLDTALLAE